MTTNRRNARYVVEYWDDESMTGPGWSYIGDADTFLGAQEMVERNQKQDKEAGYSEGLYRIRLGV